MAGSKRERDLHRAKVARQQKEAAEAAERRKRRILVGGAIGGVVLVIAAVVGVAVATSDDDSTPAAANPSTSASPAPTGSPASSQLANAVVCKPVNKKKPTKEFTGSPTGTVNPDGTYTVAVETNCGLNMELALDSKNAPKTTNAFTFLTDRNFYNNTVCHRLATNIHVLQCGDPTGTGKGGPGFTLPEENLPKADANGNGVYPRGTIAMANAGAGTTGSQFFIVYEDVELPANYTILGQVTEGMEIIDHVASEGTVDGSADGKPKQPLQITKAVSTLTVTPDAPQ